MKNRCKNKVYLFRSGNIPGQILVFVSVIFIIAVLYGSVFAQENTEKVILKRIEQLQKDIEKKQEELEKSRKKLQEKEKEKKDVLEQLKYYEKESAVLNQNIQKIRGEENYLESQIISSEKQLIKSKGDLQSHKEEYAQRLCSMYKRQRVSALEMVFSTGSFSSMLRGFKMLTVLAEADLRDLELIRTLTYSVENSMNTLKTSLKAKKSLEREQSSARTNLEKTKKVRKQLLAEITEDEELNRELMMQHQNDIKLAQTELEKWQKKIDREVKELSIPEELKNYNFASRKGKLPWPVQGRVVSTFGVMTDPKTKTKTNNRGIEFATNHNEPVCSIGSGIVVMTQYIRGYGNFVWIYHPPNYYTIYAHLSDILVNNQQFVREGDFIGLAGSTGLIDDKEARLLLEVLNGKNPENPLTWLEPATQRAGI